MKNKWVKERERQKELSGRERRKETGWGELKHNLRSGCTHRGGWAIGPGSTPPSFVLTPAAFPPVRLVPFTLPFAAASVVVHAWGEVAWIVTFSCSVWLPFSVAVSVSALIQASGSLAVSSVEWPVLRWAIVIAATPWAYITSFLSVSPSPSVSISVSVTAWRVGRWSSVPVSSPSVSVSISVSVTVLVAASTVSVRRRVPSSVRHRFSSEACTFVPQKIRGGVPVFSFYLLAKSMFKALLQASSQLIFWLSAPQHS